MRSVPPRGSGWVRGTSDCERMRPTRYREVVLTSWDRDWCVPLSTRMKDVNDYYFINLFDGNFGSSTFSALSTPATGRLDLSIKPSCASTEAWSQ